MNDDDLGGLGLVIAGVGLVLLAATVLGMAWAATEAWRRREPWLAVWFVVGVMTFPIGMWAFIGWRLAVRSGERDRGTPPA